MLESQNTKLSEEVEKLKVLCEDNRLNNKETYDKLFFGINNQSLHQTQKNRVFQKKIEDLRDALNIERERIDWSNI